jgi:hypothetical protein
MDRMTHTSPRRTARIAGALYLLVIAAGPIALSIRSGLIVRGDAAATAANIMASETLYRFGVAAELIAAVSYIGVTLFLYDLLRPVSPSVSLRAAFFGFAGCVTSAVVSLNLLVPLALLGGAASLSVFSHAQVQALALTFTRVFAQGSSVTFIFFGCYCLILGYLVSRSDFMPRALGALLAMAGVGWLTSSAVGLLAPALSSLVAPYALAAGGIGEGAFTLWLLMRGVNAQRWMEQAGLVAEVRS